jgi:hypothetical protein
MKHINNREAYRLLSEAGFTDLEISQLIQLRRDSTAGKLDQTHSNHPRLQLVWWVCRTLLTHDIWYVLSHRPKV